MGLSASQALTASETSEELLIHDKRMNIFVYNEKFYNRLHESFIVDRGNAYIIVGKEDMVVPAPDGAMHRIKHQAYRIVDCVTTKGYPETFTMALAVAPLMMILAFTSFCNFNGFCPRKENISQKSAYKTEETQFGDIDVIHNNQDNIANEDSKNQSELEKVYDLDFKIKVAI